MYTLRFDMHAPVIGAPTAEVYAAATDLCAWAEGHGCLAAVLCEHHGAEDGYLPTPLILGSAIAWPYLERAGEVVMSEGAE